MQLRFLGTETTGGQSPTLYATDQDSYVVQGWVVTDPDVPAMQDLASDETLVEIYARLMAHLTKDGLSGEVVNERYPIVHIRENGNYILRGRRIVDPTVLEQMDIPGHETAIEVSKSSVVELVEGVDGTHHFS